MAHSNDAVSPDQQDADLALKSPVIMVKSGVFEICYAVDFQNSSEMRK